MKTIEELKKLLDDLRTGLKDSSDTNKTRSQILAMFESTAKDINDPTKTTEEIIKAFKKKFVIKNKEGIEVVMAPFGDNGIPWKKEAIESFLTSTITDIQREMVTNCNRLKSGKQRLKKELSEKIYKADTQIQRAIVFQEVYEQAIDDVIDSLQSPDKEEGEVKNSKS